VGAAGRIRPPSVEYTKREFGSGIWDLFGLIMRPASLSLNGLVIAAEIEMKTRALAPRLRCNRSLRRS